VLEEGLSIGSSSSFERRRPVVGSRNPRLFGALTSMRHPVFALVYKPTIREIGALPIRLNNWELNTFLIRPFQILCRSVGFSLMTALCLKDLAGRLSRTQENHAELLEQF